MKILILLCLLVCVPSVVLSQNTQVKIYLGNSEKNSKMDDCGKVFVVTRSVPKTKMVAKAALLELFKGVTAKEKAKSYESVFSAESSSILKSLNVSKGSAFVNFNSSIQQSVSSASASCARDTFFSQIEKTLKQFSSVKKVFYAIEGKPADFYDWIGIGECPKELKKCSGKSFR
jgi:Sporulation and spore germination